MNTNESKRLAKNTIYLYIRMAATLLIGLYASRLLLKTLGIDDFGIFNLVGSIIAIVEMLKSMFSTATQRFLNLEIGRKDFQRLQEVFNMSIWINIFMAIVFVVVIEIIGLWFFTYKINISPDRIFAAKCVLQISVLISVISVMTAPFDAIIIAQERMNFFALSSIIDSVLKLVIILLTPLFCADNLIVYTSLFLIETIVIRIINASYCKRNFPECKYKRCWDKQLFKQMFSFASWQLLGNGANTITTNGLNMVFNIFGGTVVNAARGIAYKVQQALYQFLVNIEIAISPYSFKAFAKGEKEEMFNMLFFSSKIFLTIGFCINIPFLYFTKEVLYLWLGEVIPFSVGFVQIILVCSIVHSVYQPIDTLFKAVGKIKYYQIAEGIIMLLPLLAAYLVLKCGYSMYIAFSMLIVFEIINLIVIALIAKNVAQMNLLRYTKSVFIPMLLYLCMGLSGFWLIKEFFSSIGAKIIILAIVEVFAVLYLYFFNLDYKERLTINTIIKDKIKKKKAKQ